MKVWRLLLLVKCLNCRCTEVSFSEFKKQKASLTHLVFLDRCWFSIKYHVVERYTLLVLIISLPELFPFNPLPLAYHADTQNSIQYAM